MESTNKRRSFYTALLAMLVVFSSCTQQPSNGISETANSPASSMRYGVFIGADPEQMDELLDYDLIVIDTAYYTKVELEKLHQNGIVVYSYLNIGSLETFRDFFPIYEHLSLGEYEDWPDEYWMDVSDEQWQKQVDQQANRLIEKGVDGFFIDNADVYYQYQRTEIFDGLVTILNQLNEYEKDIIINGGDVFVTEAVLEAESPVVSITGVNQECVFTRIDFEKEQLLPQTKENTKYYQEYLKQCKINGLEGYLLEYAETDALQREIEQYCSANQFHYFLSPSINLDAEFESERSD